MNRLPGIIIGCFFLVASLSASAQTTTISGSVTDQSNNEPLIGVNIIVKGRVIGTTTDVNGNFSLTVNQSPPLTLEISYIGFKTIEEPINDSNTSGLKISMEEQTVLGHEVVVSASRVEESIMESPVTIDKMDIIGIQNTTSDNYYKGLQNLPGVDMTTSSINFQIVNTRGFGSTGNTRFVQLTDGMDTQAPALNFPIGNLNGPSELDVESVELIPGASSALYGPNAFNGMILITSKNPFEYQGLSAFVKTGVNHINDSDYKGPAPLVDASVRYAKVFNNRFAFKVNGSYMRAEDWHGTNAYDRTSERTPEGFNFDPGADKLNFMGDEASVPLAILRFSTTSGGNVGWQSIAQGPDGTFDVGTTAWKYAQNGWLPNDVVSVTPLPEKDVVDYGAENKKLNVGLYYRLNDKSELSYLYNGGFGTSVYTGAQRYSLENFSIQQHRLQLRGDNYYLRAYATLENSGDSYIAEFLAKRLNDIRSGGDVSSWLGYYAIYYLRYLYDQGYTDPTIPRSSVNIPISEQEAAHEYARAQTDARFPYNVAKDKATALKGVIPNGPKFQDRTRLYHAEGQYDFKNQVKFMELQTGGSYRIYDLNSNGTIFDDAYRDITISEYGIYTQAGKWVANNHLKVGGSVRYDKNQNFEGRFSPRISTLIKAGDNQNFRLSYQTGFRNPDTQGQHIDLNTISARLLGGLPEYAEKYQIPRISSTGQILSYTASSVQAFRDKVFSTGVVDPTLLQDFSTFNPVKPERIQDFEVGYKALFNNKLLIDLSAYYNIYHDFITEVVTVTAKEFTHDPSRNFSDNQYTYTPDTSIPEGSANYLTLLNGTAHIITSHGIDGNTSSLYTNAPGRVTAEGFVASLTYNLENGYTIGYNYNWNKLQNVPQDFIAEFNTPQHKMNIMFGNRKLTDRVGFDLTWRWQSAFDWQSSFTDYKLYPVPAYSTLDAQVTYKVPSMKSTIKLGATNLLNKYYYQSGGGPNIGGLYYISVLFDQLMR